MTTQTIGRITLDMLAELRALGPGLDDDKLRQMIILQGGSSGGARLLRHRTRTTRLGIGRPRLAERGHGALTVVAFFRNKAQLYAGAASRRQCSTVATPPTLNSVATSAPSVPPQSPASIHPSSFVPDTAVR